MRCVVSVSASPFHLSVFTLNAVPSVRYLRPSEKLVKENAAAAKALKDNFPLEVVRAFLLWDVWDGQQ